MGSAPIGRAPRPADGAVPVRTFDEEFDETELVNATVCAHVNYTSGGRRVLAIVLWAVAAVLGPGLPGQ